MPLDPGTLAESKAWFKKALIDIRAARLEVGVTPTLTTDIVFHAQQAAEKSLKGFLTFHAQAFRRTHSLIELGEACVALDPTLEDLLRRAAGLTEYAWRFRYPGDPEEPDDAEAGEALSLAHTVYEAILSRLPEEVNPGFSPLGL
jgi:HEPN domain-containing protein